MIYCDNGIIDEDGISLRTDLNNAVKIGNIVYSFFGYSHFDLLFKNGLKTRVSLSHPKNKIEIFFFRKRRKMIEESHFWLVDAFNEVQREKKEQPDWYRGG